MQKQDTKMPHQVAQAQRTQVPLDCSIEIEIDLQQTVKTNDNAHNDPVDSTHGHGVDVHVCK